MDITMPEMDGILAVKKLKEMDENAKIIMVSAVGQRDFVIDAVQSGAVDFIVKLFQEGKIREVLDRVRKSVKSKYN